MRLREEDDGKPITNGDRIRVMRDKLISLLYGTALHWSYEYSDEDFLKDAERTADHLIARGVTIATDDNETDCGIDIPCKIGDAVWIIRRYRGAKRAKKGIVSEMHLISDRLSMTDEMKLLITVRGIGRGYWGKNIFATQEEAEKAKEENEFELLKL